MNEVSGTLESLCLSVRLCRFVFGLSRYFALTLDYHIWHIGVHVSPWDDVHVYSWSRYYVDLWPQSEIYRFLFLLWRWLNIFGTRIYNHERMCRVYLWSRYAVDLWPWGLIYRVDVMSLCPTRNFCLLWHWYTYLAYGCTCITMRIVSRSFVIPILRWHLTSRSNIVDTA